jgi:hypothetical protein
MKKDLTRFLGKIVFVVVVVLIGFEVLFRLGFRPIITNSLLFDYKVLWLQKHPLKEVKLMAAGSSITLSAIDSRTITEAIHLPYYNFGSFNMQMGDTRLLLGFLVKEYHPGYVLICSSLADFTNVNNPTYVNYTTASRWEREKLPELFYFTQFHSIHQILIRKRWHDHVKIDQWGGGGGTMEFDDAMAAKEHPVSKRHWDDMIIKGFPNYAFQYAQLDSIGAFLQAKGVKFIFAQAPVKASLLEKDTISQWVEPHFATCRALVEKHGGVYFNYCDTTIFRDSLFIDPVHLCREGAQLMTKRLVADLQQVIK